MTRRAAAAGFTLLELAVALIIIGVLTGVLLQRLTIYQHDAELAYAERMAGSLRSAMMLKVSHLIATGRQDQVAALVHENPMNWLADRPPNYVGEYFAPTSAQIAARSWYFDRRAKLLVYVPARDFLPLEAVFSDPKPALHYRLMLAPQPPLAVGQGTRTAGLELVQVD